MRRNTTSVIKAMFFPITFNSDVILSLRQIFRENVLSVNYKGIYRHRRTGNFLPGGAVNHLPKKISQVAQIFTKESKRNEGHIATT